MSENTPTLVRKWIALLDAAEYLMQTAEPHDPCAMKRVGMAIDSLFRFASRYLGVATLPLPRMSARPSPERTVSGYLDASGVC